MDIFEEKDIINAKYFIKRKVLSTINFLSAQIIYYLVYNHTQVTYSFTAFKQFYAIEKELFSINEMRINFN